MAGRIPEHIIEQVRQANDVAEVIQTYLPLKRKGAGFWALCPFHKEKTPSFQVNPQKQIWHCFGCGEGGNVFGFLMKYENLDFVAAVRRLAERAGVQLELAEDRGAAPRDLKDQLYKLHEEAARYFHELLLKHPAAGGARAYVEKRQLAPATLKAWSIGYSLDSWDGLLNWARGRQYSADLVETAGLALRQEERKQPYDRFRGRLMFAIRDEQGRVVGFSGRILTDAKDQPKYVNSPETPIFQKGRVLFALDRARRPIIEAKLAVLCEGQIDTISCHVAGIENVVAPQGTALTEQHARILKRFTDDVVLMFDADAAGQNAAVRGAEPCLAAGLSIRVAPLPAGHDPDSLIRQSGPEPVRRLVAEAPGFFDYLLDRLAGQHGTATPAAKARVAAGMLEWITKVPNPVLRAAHLRQTADRLGVTEAALLQELQRLERRHPGVATDSPLPADQAEVVWGSNAEQLLLQAMLADERMIDVVAERLQPEWLAVSVAGGLIQRVLDLVRRKLWTGPASLLNQGGADDGGRLVSRLLLERPPPEDKLPAAVADCLRRLEQGWVESEWSALRTALRQPGLTPARLAELQRQVLDLRSRLDNISRLASR